MTAALAVQRGGVMDERLYHRGRGATGPQNGPWVR
jgi:hypothetical protein